MKRGQDEFSREDKSHVELFVIWTEINENVIESEAFAQFPVLPTITQIIWAGSVMRWTWGRSW